MADELTDTHRARVASFQSARTVDELVGMIHAFLDETGWGVHTRRREHLFCVLDDETPGIVRHWVLLRAS